MDEKTLLWIILSLIFPVASMDLYNLYMQYGSCEEIIYQIKSDNIWNINPEIKELIFSAVTKKQAEDIAKYCVYNNISVIPIESKFYPQQLLNISDPPLIIYCKGNLNSLYNKNSAAIVGARNADKYSLSCAQRFSECLTEYGINIISGFASGVDSAAHYGALKVAGQTVAVLGCGINVDYPFGTMEIKEKIADKGAVISEYPPLELPKPTNYKVRNRIISGLSKGVLVVEAGEKSGSLNTISHALNQGKDVYVIPPHNIFDRRFAGQISLLEDGAKAVYSPDELAKDIIRSF